MSFFGDLERFLADLYPYRWPIAVGILIVLAATSGFAYRRGWHMAVWRHRRVGAIVGTLALVLTIPIGW